VCACTASQISCAPRWRAVPEHDRLAVAFGRVLRGVGLDVPLGATMMFARSIDLVGLERREHVYWAGRATFVKRPDDVEVYDRAFSAFWLGVAPASDAESRMQEDIVFGVDTELPASEETPAAEPAGVPDVALRWSPAEVLRHVDFAAYTAAEFAEARRLMADLRLAGALKPTRRRRPTTRRRGHPDVRRTVRRALRTGGEPLDRRFVVAAAQPRRMVLLLDVSGSMEPYARAFVRFLHAAVVGRTRVEAFALGTRVTRITRELSSRDPDAAVRAAADRVVDWAGGTRLGEGLRAFTDTWGVRGLARGAVVVILSDGWDRGRPEQLGEQMARLRRVAYKLIWVNPLKASPGYAPLARGMAAALPHVDAFVEGHSLAALEDLAEVMSE
jgi:uncharacterized protein